MNQSTTDLRLKTKYEEVIVPALVKELKLKNALTAPRVTKIVVNIGITEPQGQSQALKNVAQQLAQITGQQPKTTLARVSISSFKLRQGDPIGLKVTLRGKRMYQFLDKLVSIVLPRVKDFQGLPATGFDGQGNYNLGLEEQIVFPEIDYDTIDKVRGLQITLVTNTTSNTVAKSLFSKLGVPFVKDQESN